MSNLVRKLHRMDRTNSSFPGRSEGEDRDLIERARLLYEKAKQGTWTEHEKAILRTGIELPQRGKRVESHASRTEDMVIPGSDTSDQSNASSDFIFSTPSSIDDAFQMDSFDEWNVDCDGIVDSTFAGNVDEISAHEGHAEVSWIPFTVIDVGKKGQEATVVCTSITVPEEPDQPVRNARKRMLFIYQDCFFI